MDNKILYAAKFTHHDIKFHKVWWKSDKTRGSWSGQTDRQTDSYIPPQTTFLYVCGGYNKMVITVRDKDICKRNDSSLLYIAQPLTV